MVDFDFLEEYLGIVFPPHFTNSFARKYFSWCILLTLNLFVWLPLVLEIFGNICIANVCFSAYEVLNFEINLIFSNQAVFLHDQKSQDKNIDILRAKKAFEMK